MTGGSGGGGTTGVDPAAVGEGHWTLDPASSSVEVRHRTMWGLADIRGVFATVRGEGEVAADGTGRGRLVMDTASFDTQNAQRDTHLRGREFFDVASHPEIVFEAATATAGEHGTVDVAGTLSVRGRTRPLSLTAAATEAGPDAVTLTARVELDRADFGLEWNQLGMMKGLARVSLEVRFVRERPETPEP